MSAQSADNLRRAMRRFASGVTIVTLHDGRRDAGLTVSAFSSISLDPAIVMVAINATGSIGEITTGATSFAVHILGAEHEELSIRFSESIPWRQKVAGVDIERGELGTPVLGGIPTVIEARVRSQVLVGSHHVTFGDVVSIRLETPAPDRPLLYFDRDYRTIDGREESEGDRDDS